MSTVLLKLLVEGNILARLSCKIPLEYRHFFPKEGRASLFPIFPCFGENTGLFFLFAQKPFPLEYQELSCSSDSSFPREQEIQFFHVVVGLVRQAKTDCVEVLIGKQKQVPECCIY